MSATESDETQGLTTEPKPLYGCQYGEDCAPHVSYPADMLAVWNGQAVCESCFENDPVAACQDNLEDELMWSDLPPFVPAHERRIERLREGLGKVQCYSPVNIFIGPEAAIKACGAIAEHALAEDDKAGEPTS